ncbi:hypothetical protein, partial [Macrococcus capreoli]|uniref:hypothetical protein n=1 Tax=Macrococcus capreoli TaxID=2982690 RepID=UPI003EE51639
SAPAGYNVFYTTDNIPNNTNAGVLKDSLNWSSSVGDYSKVTGIKVVSQDGQVIAPGSKVDVIVPMKMPDNISGKDKVAVNTFALSQGGNIFNEANPVKVTLTNYNLSGYLFNDKNNDGYMNNGE